MIKELYHYWTTPCSPAARKLGYLKELIAIEARARRVAPYWKSHQEKSRKVILQALDQCPRFDQAVILGGGLLFDIPMETLTKRFSEVVIVDIVLSKHLRTIKKRYPNVTCLEHDITGTAEALADFEIEKPLPKPSNRLPEILAKADFVASVNLLSQLPLIPCEWLMKKGMDGQLIDGWCSQIINAHLEQLNQLTGNVCLITDTEHHYLDRSGKCHKQIDMMNGLQLPAPNRQWQWSIAPCSEADRNCEIVAAVSAWEKWHQID